MAAALKSVAFCESCNRPFGVTNNRLSHGPEEPESISCAHCRALHSTARTNGFFIPYKLTPEDESRWLAEHKPT